MVALHHAITLGTESALRTGSPALEGLSGWTVKPFFTIGVLAVPTFLFISGSFAAYAARGEPPRISRRFLVATLARLFWPYLIWSLVSYGAASVWLGERHSLFGYAKNLVVGYPLHFVPLLTLFYLLSPVLVRVGRRHAVVLITGIGLYQLLLIGLVHPGALGLRVPTALQIVAPPVL